MEAGIADHVWSLGDCGFTGLIFGRSGYSFASKGRKMKSATLTTILLLGLALMSNGCASFTPPTPPRTENVADGNTDEDWVGWPILYWTLYGLGQALVNK